MLIIPQTWRRCC